MSDNTTPKKRILQGEFKSKQSHLEAVLDDLLHGKSGFNYYLNWKDQVVLERLSFGAIELSFPDLPEDFSTPKAERQFQELAVLWMSVIRNTLPSFILRVKDGWDYALCILLDYCDTDTSEKLFNAFRYELDEKTGIQALVEAYFRGVPLQDLINTDIPKKGEEQYYISQITKAIQGGSKHAPQLLSYLAC